MNDQIVYTVVFVACLLQNGKFLPSEFLATNSYKGGFSMLRGFSFCPPHSSTANGLMVLASKVWMDASVLTLTANWSI